MLVRTAATATLTCVGIPVPRGKVNQSRRAAGVPTGSSLYDVGRTGFA